MAKTPVVDALVRIRCSKPAHINCTEMQDLLLESCVNVTEATTIRSYSEPFYCVFAMAKVDKDRMTQFKKKIQRLEKGDLKVSDFSINVLKDKR